MKWLVSDTEKQLSQDFKPCEGQEINEVSTIITPNEELRCSCPQPVRKQILPTTKVNLEVNLPLVEPSDEITGLATADIGNPAELCSDS